MLDLFDYAKERASIALKTRFSLEENKAIFDLNKLDEYAEILAISALKYNCLRRGANSDDSLYYQEMFHVKGNTSSKFLLDYAKIFHIV